VHLLIVDEIKTTDLAHLYVDVHVAV